MVYLTCLGGSSYDIGNSNRSWVTARATSPWTKPGTRTWTGSTQSADLPLTDNLDHHDRWCLQPGFAGGALEAVVLEISGPLLTSS
ncbi:MAG: hypothetical protein H0T99_10620 [Geodermatophilaceae bacterium]|nr:hypothetical protein [Geodermatophilaceae bacterium]